jgi:hypothetical protein
VWLSVFFPRHYVFTPLESGTSPKVRAGVAPSTVEVNVRVRRSVPRPPSAILSAAADPRPNAGARAGGQVDVSVALIAIR